MGELNIQPGVLTVSIRAALEAALNLFRQRGKAAERIGSQRMEEKWARDYMTPGKINFSEIFSVRLTNYAANGSTIEAQDEKLDEILKSVWGKLYKWLPLSIATGRAYLLPYIVGDRVYVSYIPQSQIVETEMTGDDVIGFVSVSDTKSLNNRTYCRIEQYHFDLDTQSFSISNKAVEKSSGREVSLEIIPAWGKIQPLIVFTGVERPLFGYVDSPRDNRNPSKPSGAGILFGCDNTVREIMDCISQYETEYANKGSVLGVNQAILPVERDPMTGMERAGATADMRLPPRYIKYDAIGKLGGDQSDLFSVFSPDIRSQAYKERLLDLFGRLEKQVGTSSGILTPAETAQATATQVRRTMYDTLCMVDRIHQSVEHGIDQLAYAISVQLSAIGQPITDTTASITWGDGMEQSKEEHFQMMSQAHSANVISDAEYRQEIYPGESIEEAQAAIDAIKASQPEPIFNMFPGEGDA